MGAEKARERRWIFFVRVVIMKEKGSRCVCVGESRGIHATGCISCGRIFRVGNGGWSLLMKGLPPPTEEEEGRDSLRFVHKKRQQCRFCACLGMCGSGRSLVAPQLVCKLDNAK
ncbi:hypothetical protein AVEN_162827-1 [Araneus ventricosus]|uniref:Uncharacterized protein n=1 Tax=Araneus ventricosus TaxID=182803 RepID=A0A4Y2C824_ARAVE|nr:hypothetical protein AVEN_162827-1 [Araneus ventricosus]